MDISRPINELCLKIMQFSVKKFGVSKISFSLKELLILFSKDLIKLVKSE